MPAKFGGATVQRHLLTALSIAILAVAISTPFRPVASQAFTLINGCGKAPLSYVTISPTSGLPTATFTVRGVCNGATCGSTLTFYFYWDSPTFAPFWSPNVTCNFSKVYDSGQSPAFSPPATGNAVGSHKVILNILGPTGAPVPGGAQSTAYTITAPPPPPPPPSPTPSTQSQPSPVRSTPPAQAHPSPTPTPTPTPTSTSTPTSAACPATGMLPPSGTGSWGDNLIAGLVVGAVVPIAGLALFGPGALLAAARRRRRLLMLIGLSALTAMTLSCTTTTVGTHNPTPAALISPAASPSCSA